MYSCFGPLLTNPNWEGAIPPGFWAGNPGGDTLWGIPPPEVPFVAHSPGRLAAVRAKTTLLRACIGESFADKMTFVRGGGGDCRPRALPSPFWSQEGIEWDSHL